MIREGLSKKGMGAELHFKWRGKEVTRIEGFSDAVFAFAMTLIVVSLEVPKSFSQLLDTMRGFLAFGTCFSILIWIWYWHYKFFRRYGLTDMFTIVLNAVLLFVVLFYVFPLKFVFTYVINGLFFPDMAAAYKVSIPEVGVMMMIYASGFFLIFLIFAGLYGHAYRLRDELELNAVEMFETKTAFQACILLMGIAVLSMMFATFDHPFVSGFLAGISYALIGPVLSIHGWWRGKRLKILMKSL